MRILLVEDDELLGSGLSDALEFARYAHEWVREANWPWLRRNKTIST